MQNTSRHLTYTRTVSKDAGDGFVVAVFAGRSSCGQDLESGRTGNKRHGPRFPIVVLRCPLPARWFGDSSSRKRLRELRCSEHRASYVANMACRLPQLRRILPPTRTHDKYRQVAFPADHPDRQYQVRIVRNDYRRFEQTLPRVVQQMHRKINVRPLLFLGMKLGDHGIGDEHAASATRPIAVSAPLRISADG